MPPSPRPRCYCGEKLPDYTNEWTLVVICPTCKRQRCGRCGAEPHTSSCVAPPAPGVKITLSYTGLTSEEHQALIDHERRSRQK
jgi:hypothetical protein